MARKYSLKMYREMFLKKKDDPALLPHCLNFPNDLWAELMQCKQITGDNATQIMVRATRAEVERLKKFAEALARKGLFKINGKILRANGNPLSK